MSVFAPVGEVVERFARDHRQRLWIASGFIGADLHKVLDEWRVTSARMLVGVDPDAVVDPAMHQCLSTIARQHDLRLLGNLHAKVVLAPGRAALVGSMNLSRNGLEMLEEVGVMVEGPQDLAQLRAIYERWWSDAMPFASAHLCVSPDGIGGRERVPTAGRRHRFYKSAFTKVRGRNGDDGDEAEREGDPVAVFAALSADAAIQTRIAAFFADALRALDDVEKGGHWALTLPGKKKGLLRLNVGGVQAAVAVVGGIAAHVVLSRRDLYALEAMGVEVEDGYPRARNEFDGDARWLFAPEALYERALPALLRGLRRFLDASKHRTSFARYHSPEAVEYLENRTGVRLPRPRGA